MVRSLSKEGFRVLTETAAVLRQWLSSSYLHEFTTKFANLVHYMINRNVFTATKRVFTVAPHTTHGTTCKPNKRAGTTRMRRFALNGTKYFGNS